MNGDIRGPLRVRDLRDQILKVFDVNVRLFFRDSWNRVWDARNKGAGNHRVVRMTNGPVGSYLRKVDQAEASEERANIKVWPNLLWCVVAGTHKVLWPDDSKETKLVLNGDGLVLTPLLKKTVHKVSVSLLDVIDENGWLTVVAVPILGLRLVVDTTSSAEVVKVIASLACTGRAIDPEVVVLERAFQWVYLLSGT